MLDNVREDLRRYGMRPSRQMRAVLLSQGAWAVIAYRFSHWVYSTHLPRPLWALMKTVAALVRLCVEILTNICLPPEAEIGPGLFIVHTGYVVVSSTAVLGRHCTLAQGVTIGHGTKDGKIGSTTIGNRVYIAPGAAVIGPITIGDDALIGVNSVVTQSVPPRGVVAGNPGHVISFKGSFDLIYYPGMDRDAARLAGLAEAEERGDRKPSADDPYVVSAAAHFHIDVGAHPPKAAPSLGEVSNSLLPEK